jgi:hypothetical protein
MQLTLTRLVVRRVLHAIHLVRHNRNVLIANCHLYDNRGIGVYLDDVDLHQINVTACHISFNAQGGVVSRAGNVRNLHLTGCDIEANMSPETPPTANVLIDCTGSVVGTAEVAITGCTIQHSGDAPGSANIRMLGRGDPTRTLARARWGNVTITGNILSDVQVNVHLQNCRGVTVTGNTFWLGFQHHLLVEGSASVVLGPNAFDRNPGYARANAGRDSIAIRDSEDCTVTGLHLTEVRGTEAAILIENCRRFNLASCTVLDSDGPGLLLRNVSESLVTGWLIRDSRPRRAGAPSLRVEGGRDNVIANNVLAQGRADLLPRPAGAPATAR